MAEAFHNHIHHLLAELQRVDLLIRQYVARTRNGWEIDDYHGLVISEQEIDELLGHPVLTAERLGEAGSGPVDSQMAELRSGIARRAAESEAAGIPLRLPRLVEMFGLSDLEVDALLICLAIELDLRYERLYAYAQDDVTKKQPRVDLILNVLCSNLADRLAARTIFMPTKPLLRYNLVEITAEPGQSYTALLGRFVHIQRRILDFLLGLDEMDERILSFARSQTAARDLDSLTLPQRVREWLRGMLSRWQDPGEEQMRLENSTLYLQGQYGSGRSAISEALSQALGRRLLTVDVSQMLENARGGVNLVFREARLQGAVLLLRNFEGEEPNRLLLRDDLLSGIENHSGLVCMAGESDWEPRGKLGDRLFMRLGLDTPDYATRAALWRQEASAVTLSRDTFSPEDLGSLANKFAFTPGQIHDAVMAARGLAAWRNTEEQIHLDELYAAARAQSTPILNTMARKITPRFGWDDIVLIEDSLEILHEISNTIKHRHVVYGEWGFEKKLATGLGLNVLFAGESGTGKTMAADIMAGELGLDLYKIDLSGIISKYIGETEKNLDRIFAEARTSNAILFFDEADAVFGKRSEVRDSHDRYANIEISYLLQKMEEYDGVVILATNLASNMDEAFVRRMHFVVDFPIPEADYRLRIWQVHFPTAAPQGDDLDLEFMAQRFKIAGGNIRNIVLGSAFLAAEDGEPIRMKHLARAARRELQKMGRLVREVDFGEYYHMINGGDGDAP
jgi:MoxR-like ATPase